MCTWKFHENFSFQNMDSEEDIVIAVAVLNLIKRKRKKKNHKNSQIKRSIWTKPQLICRPSLGICNTLNERANISRFFFSLLLFEKTFWKSYLQTLLIISENAGKVTLVDFFIKSFHDHIECD